MKMADKQSRIFEVGTIVVDLDKILLINRRDDDEGCLVWLQEDLEAELTREEGERLIVAWIRYRDEH